MASGDKNSKRQKKTDSEYIHVSVSSEIRDIDNETSSEPRKQYDLNKLSFSQALKLLQEEGYQLREEDGNYLKDENKTVVTISVLDRDSGPEGAIYFKDYGYYLHFFETPKEALEEWLGCLVCGGMYTCAALFDGENNLYQPPEENCAELMHILPEGNSKIPMEDY